MASEKEIKISISTATLLKAVAIVAIVALFIYLQHIVAILLISLLLAAMIDPLADWFEAHRIKRGLAVAGVYVVLLALLVGVIVLILPALVEQSSALLTRYAPYIEQATGNSVVVQEVLSGEIFERDLTEIVHGIQSSGLANAAPEIFELLSDIFGGVITLLLVVILSFYMVVEKEALRKIMLLATPRAYDAQVKKLVPQVRRKIGAWLRGQLLVMFVIFALTYVFLLLAGVPYALVLALVAGLLEVVPYIGPNISAIPAILIGLTVSPLLAVVVAVFYFALQQFEGDILTPKIMQRVGGLNPIISIVAIMIGWTWAGVIGTLLAIPTAMIIGVVLGEVYQRK